VTEDVLVRIAEIDQVAPVGQDELRIIIQVFHSFFEKLYRRVLESGRGPFALGFEEEGEGVGVASQQGHTSSKEEYR
jgi:hypothetical protein